MVGIVELVFLEDGIDVVEMYVGVAVQVFPQDADGTAVAFAVHISHQDGGQRVKAVKTAHIFQDDSYPQSSGRTTDVVKVGVKYTDALGRILTAQLRHRADTGEKGKISSGTALFRPFGKPEGFIKGNTHVLIIHDDVGMFIAGRLGTLISSPPDDAVVAAAAV